MAERSKYAKVRQEIIDALKVDLIGPQADDEVIDENPKFAYLIGMLAPKAPNYSSIDNEQEVDTDIAYEDGSDFTAGEDDDNEPITVTHFDPPSSIGISFYVESSLSSINLEVNWGDYIRSTQKRLNKDEKEIRVATFSR